MTTFNSKKEQAVRAQLQEQGEPTHTLTYDQVLRILQKECAKTIKGYTDGCYLGYIDEDGGFKNYMVSEDLIPKDDCDMKTFILPEHGNDNNDDSRSTLEEWTLVDIDTDVEDADSDDADADDSEVAVDMKIINVEMIDDDTVSFELVNEASDEL